MTRQEASDLLWSKVEMVRGVALDPHMALSFVEGGNLREAMEQLFITLARVAMKHSDEQELARIATHYRLEISRLPSLGRQLQ